MEANEEDRKTLMDRTVLPPGKAKDPVEIQVMRSESVVVISDLPFRGNLRVKTLSDLNKLFPQWVCFRIAPKDGTRYWHPEYDDGERLFRFPRDARPEYPQKESDKFKVGTQLNKILRHYIGQDGKKQTNWTPISCNEGGWVLLEDMLSLDYVWEGWKVLSMGTKTMTEGNF